MLHWIAEDWVNEGDLEGAQDQRGGTFGSRAAMQLLGLPQPGDEWQDSRKYLGYASAQVYPASQHES